MEPAVPSAESGISSALKRKRSPSISNPPPSAPVAKSAKSTGSHLSINYLARSSNDDLPLVNKDDSLPNLLHLLSLYSTVLDRHESLASNLGARPLGPILIKRFERCFDAPPRIVASHVKSTTNAAEDSSHQITWLEVIEFARSHPSQFTLSTFSEGRRVCQFYYPQKQLRVQISEEDFLFINSGRCQELIPPLPIWEDEEKEVATCDVLEAKLRELTNAADMVAARTRQLGHRLKGRRNAILERRAEGGSGTPAKASAQQTTTAPQSSTSSSSAAAAASAGFTAVNTNSGRPAGDELASSATVKNDLIRHFESLPQNQHQARNSSRNSISHEPTHSSHAAAKQQGDVAIAQESHRGGRAASTASSLSPVPPNAFSNDLGYCSSDSPAINAPTTTSGHRQSTSAAAQNSMKHNFSRPLPPALESSQPFRPLCQAHMDSLPRGHRVLPPCDRCRRLRMDCVKNLTSCAGCTKKHARCHWRDVSRDELGALEHLMESGYAAVSAQSPGYDGREYINSNDEAVDAQESDDEDSNPLDDLEALGEQEEREREDTGEAKENTSEVVGMSWENGLRSAQAPTAALDAITPASVKQYSDVGMTEKQDIEPESKLQRHHPTAPYASETERVSSSKANHDAKEVRANDDNNLSPKRQDTSLNLPAITGNADLSTAGFRPMNGSYTSTETHVKC